MARLTPQQWEQARADYEVRGISLGEVARQYGVTRQAVSLRASKDGWQQGKTCGLVNKKVNALKELAKIDAETCRLPQVFRLTVEQAVRERLESEGLLAALGNRIASRAIAMTVEADTPEALETLSRVKRNLTPQQDKGGTTVNVNQQQAQSMAPDPSAVMADIRRQAAAGVEANVPDA